MAHTVSARPFLGRSEGVLLTAPHPGVRHQLGFTWSQHQCPGFPAELFWKNKFRYPSAGPPSE